MFAQKLAALVVIAGASVAWILTHGWLAALPAQILLGLMLAHAVELQHQVLHGTAFRSGTKNRVVGTLLGLPMLVSYTQYRSLHLLHHRYLGTDRDTEFFLYASNEALTIGRLLASAFNVRRWAVAVREVAASILPGRRYDAVITGERTHQRIQGEYRLMLLMLVGMVGMSLLLESPLILTLWLIPLVVAEPIHFAIELPEHTFCDRTSQQVYRNTRSIRGSWFSFWLTNGNNFHVEHHLRMGTPINKLPAMHRVVADRLHHYSPTYWQFYQDVLRRAWRASRLRW
jgi:fatty acid desaturase